MKRIILAAILALTPVQSFAAESPAEMIESLDKLYADCRGGDFSEGDPCDKLEQIEHQLVSSGYCNRKGEWVKGKAIEPTKYGFGDCR